MTCHYDVLEVETDATIDEIRRAYRRKIKSVHPDKPGGSEAKARELEEARQVLLDPLARAEYDARRLGTQFADEAVDALGDVVERAFEQAQSTISSRGRQVLHGARRHLKSYFRPKHKHKHKHK